MSVTKPQGRIAIGWATIDGKRVAITIDMEWDRFLDGLTAQSNAATAAALVGAQGAAGASVMTMDAGSFSGDVEFVPGPRGVKGDPGPAGPAIFLLEDPVENDIFWPFKP